LAHRIVATKVLGLCNGSAADGGSWQQSTGDEPTSSSTWWDTHLGDGWRQCTHAIDVNDPLTFIDEGGMSFHPQDESCARLAVGEAARRLGDENFYLLGDSITHHLAVSLRWSRRRAMLERHVCGPGDARLTVAELIGWLPWNRDLVSGDRDSLAIDQWSRCIWQENNQTDISSQNPNMFMGCGVVFASMPWITSEYDAAPSTFKIFNATFAPIEAGGAPGSGVLLLNMGVHYNCGSDCERTVATVIAALRSTKATSGVENFYAPTWNEAARQRLKVPKHGSNLHASTNPAMLYY
jgi:hypothetical protein